MEKLIYAILSIKDHSEKLNALLAGIRGIDGADLFAVTFDDITVVACDLKKGYLIADRSKAFAYAGVIEALSEQFTLLPLRFGSVMESTDAIVKMLERNYTDIDHNLLNVDYKWEFGLKVFCDAEKLMEELKTKPATGSITLTNAGTATENSICRNWVNKKLEEHRQEELLVDHVDTVIAEIKGNLTRLDAVNKFKKMMTPTTIIDAVFLLHRTHKSALVHAVGDLQNKYPCLNFILTGPWPPYNFVEFTVK